ncbi:hypothetical protein AAG570_009945 [Ranatra chinensis]|uniref:Uncharacterized protein n=1 Tax=Ranatra chinensis TaxID=642074 RepID=A0ABD0YQL5_9HEMI
MASKRRNMYQKNTKQETTKINMCDLSPFCDRTKSQKGNTSLVPTPPRSFNTEHGVQAPKHVREKQQAGDGGNKICTVIRSLSLDAEDGAQASNYLRVEQQAGDDGNMYFRMIAIFSGATEATTHATTVLINGLGARVDTFGKLIYPCPVVGGDAAMAAECRHADDGGMKDGAHNEMNRGEAAVAALLDSAGGIALPPHPSRP